MVIIKAQEVERGFLVIISNPSAFTEEPGRISKKIGKWSGYWACNNFTTGLDQK